MKQTVQTDTNSNIIWLLPVTNEKSYEHGNEGPGSLEC
jgi:hypothetical protein